MWPFIGPQPLRVTSLGKGRLRRDEILPVPVPVEIADSLRVKCHVKLAPSLWCQGQRRGIRLQPPSAVSCCAPLVPLALVTEGERSVGAAP